MATFNLLNESVDANPTTGVVNSTRSLTPPDASLSTPAAAPTPTLAPNTLPQTTATPDYASMFDDQSKTIMQTYADRQKAAQSGTDANRQLITDQSNEDLYYQNQANQNSLNSEQESRRGFATNTALMSQLQDQNQKRVRDLEKHRDYLLLSNQAEGASRIDDLIAKEQEAVTSARTQYINQLFQQNQEKRADTQLGIQQKQFEQQSQDRARTFDLQNGITQPLHRIGNTLYDSATLAPKYNINGNTFSTADGTKTFGSADEFFADSGLSSFDQIQNVDKPYTAPDYSLTITKDGTPLLIDKNSGDIKVAPGFSAGQFADASDPLDAYMKQLQIQKLQQDLDSPTPDIVRVNGQDYVTGADGKLQNPDVPEATRQASDLKQSALSSAQALLDKFNASGGSAAVGKSRIFGLQYLPGSKTKDFEIQFKNFKSLLSLDNVKFLKGQGQVSDAERQLLADSSSKLDLAQSEDEFKSSLESIIKSLQGPATAPAASADPRIQELKKNFPDATDEEIKQVLGLSSVGADTKKGSKVVMTAMTMPDGAKGGQCGSFVNQLTGLGLGDSYQSKLNKMNPHIQTPQPGMVFVMPYKDTGHTGIILSVKNGVATVKDSNYSLDGKIKTHQIPVSKMTGFAYA